MGNPKKNSKDFAPNHIGTQSKKLVAIKGSKCKTKRVNNQSLITVKRENVIILLFVTGFNSKKGLTLSALFVIVKFSTSKRQFCGNGKPIFQ